MIYRNKYDNYPIGQHDGHNVTVTRPPVWPNPLVGVRCETCNTLMTVYREELSES